MKRAKTERVNKKGRDVSNRIHDPFLVDQDEFKDANMHTEAETLRLITPYEESGYFRDLVQRV